MSSGRPRQQYGRSATTSYTNLLQDSGGDILNRCSTLFNKFASRVRASSQGGDDRVPLHTSSSSSSQQHNHHTPAAPPRPDPAANPSPAHISTPHGQYPMLLRYNKYEDSPRYNDYKSTSLLADVKAKSSKFESTGSRARDGAGSDSGYSSSGYSSRYGSSGLRGGHSLAPSASFSSFSTFKTDYGPSEYEKKRYGLSNSRPTYSRTASDLTLASDYGLGSAYMTPSVPTPNYDKIGARYKPSRFLKKSSLSGRGCAEEDEDAAALKANSTKKSDYWSQYGGMTSGVMDRYVDPTSRVGNLSPQLRRRHGDGGLVSGTSRQRGIRPVTVPEPRERESTSVIIKRYSGISTATLDTDTGSTTSSATPDSVVDEATRRKERAQLISMYSLPLNVLHSIGTSHARKFLKRGGDTAAAGDHEVNDKHRTLRYDQVKEMAARVTALSAYQDDDGSHGPPRKVYGSASTGDVLSAIARSTVKGIDGLSQTSTPDSEKYVFYDPPIVYEKAATRELVRPTTTESRVTATRPTTLTLTSSTLDSTRTKPSYISLLDSPRYGLTTPITPSTPVIKVTSYIEPDHEYTFTTFKPNTSTTSKKLEKGQNSILENTNIGYVPALTPKTPQDHKDALSVKPKTSSSSVHGRVKGALDSPYLSRYKARVDENNGKKSTVSTSTAPPPPPKKSIVSDIFGLHDSKRHHYSFCSTSSVSRAAYGEKPK